MTPNLPAAILSAVQDAAVLAFRAGADQGAAEIARLNAALQKCSDDWFNDALDKGGEIERLTKANARLVQALRYWIPSKEPLELQHDAHSLAHRAKWHRDYSLLVSAADPGAKGEG